MDIMNTIYIGKKGITLVSLVITIVIMLILAGVSINLIIQKNGLFEKTQIASEDTKKSNVKEKVEMMLSEYELQNDAKDLKTFFISKKDNKEVQDVSYDDGETLYVQVDDFIVTIIDGKIISIGKDAVTPKITDITVGLQEDGSGKNEEEHTIECGTPLYINFNHSIKDGITSVSPSIPYKVTGNSDVEFIIKGIVGDNTYIKKITVKVNQYLSSLKIGEFVNYGVTYTDIYSGNQFKANDGWRVLNPGIENADGTFNKVTLISTGIPVTFRYHYYTVSAAIWAGDENQRAQYAKKFYATASGENPNIIAASGLYYNFNKMKLNEGRIEYDNCGKFIQINNKSGWNDGLSETEFLANGATGVHNLTLYEMNDAINKNAGQNVFDVNQSTVGSNYNYINNSNDAAKGLFYLKGLQGNFKYTTDTLAYYYLASPMAANPNKSLWDVYCDGKVDYTSSGEMGLRPVIELPDNSTIEESNNQI